MSATRVFAFCLFWGCLGVMAFCGCSALSAAGLVGQASDTASSVLESAKDYARGKADEALARAQTWAAWAAILGGIGAVIWRYGDKIIERLLKRRRTRKLMKSDLPPQD